MTFPDPPPPRTQGDRVSTNFSVDAPSIAIDEDLPRRPKVNRPEPTRANPKEAVGMKKAPLHLFPSTARLAGAMAFHEGMLKYGQYNWRAAGVSASVYYDALERHMEAWWNGQDIDPKSDLHHLWKALACIAVLIDAMEVDKFIDDRPPVAPVAGMIEAMEDRMAVNVEEYGHIKPHQHTIQDAEEEG